jgi:uncharacterized protein YceH (UPF0502 family)
VKRELKILMVYNSTNVDKTNNHLSPLILKPKKPLEQNIFRAHGKRDKYYN